MHKSFFTSGILLFCTVQIYYFYFYFETKCKLDSLVLFHAHRMNVTFDSNKISHPIIKTAVCDRSAKVAFPNIRFLTFLLTIVQGDGEIHFIKRKYLKSLIILF